MQQNLINLAAAFSAFGGIFLAIEVWRGKARPTGAASWLMWVILNVLILATAWLSGSPYALALGYTTGAAFGLAGSLRGGWRWGRRETLSAACATAAFLVWQAAGAERGSVAGIVALNVAGIPLLDDLYRRPEPKMALVFGSTCVACAITLLAGNGWSWAGSLLPTTGLIFSAAVICLALRKVPEPVPRRR